MIFIKSFSKFFFKDQEIKKVVIKLVLFKALNLRIKLVLISWRWLS